MKQSVSNISKTSTTRDAMSARNITNTMERLEGRIAPAVVLSVVDIDFDGTADDVRIVGDGGNSIVEIQDNGSNMLTISIDADGDGDTSGKGDMAPTNFPFSDGSVALDVKLGGGNDELNYTATGNLSAATRLLTADLGSGSNTFAFKTGAFDVLNASRISLDVTCRTAVDAVTVDLDEVRKSSVTVGLAVGAGNDTATVDFGRIDDGSSVDVGGDLGPGVNALTMDFQQVGFGDGGTVDLDVTGGVGKDTVTLNLHDDVGNGTKASLLSFNADLGAGDDSFAANLDYANNVFRVDDHSLASIAVKAGAGNDSLSVKGVGAAGTIRVDSDARLAVDLQGGAGNDAINLDLGKSDALELIGAVRVRLAGGIGDDVLTAMLANNVNTTGSFDVAVLGGGGDDQATFQVNSNGGTPTFGPIGKAILDGGLGEDVLTNGSKPVSTAAGFEQVI